MLTLNDREWKEFFIGNIFIVKRPIARSQKDYTIGKIPFVASGNFNNGVIKCCEKHKNEQLDKGNCITVSPVDGSAFYQKFDFLGRGGAGSSILLLYSERLNHYNGVFITLTIRHTCQKYCYGKMGTQDSVRREKIMLPVNEKGQPDYEFMEQYIREREEMLLQKYKNFVTRNMKSGGVLQENVKINDEKWKEYDLIELFAYKRGNQNNMNSLCDGSNLLISAKNGNNGLKGFYDTDNKKKGLFDGHCITLNNDGDGGVGLAYYQPYSFLLDSHVYALYSKSCLNKYSLLFISKVVSKQRDCFSHGHSISKKRLMKMKIMLPVDNQGQPDYAFMECYGRSLMMKQYQRYLRYKMVID